MALVKWNKAVKEGTQEIRTSKCGMYRITKRMVASSRNGCWKAEYVIELFPAPTDSDPKTYKFDCERLSDAREAAEEDAQERADHPENFSA